MSDINIINIEIAAQNNNTPLMEYMCQHKQDFTNLAYEGIKELISKIFDAFLTDELINNFVNNYYYQEDEDKKYGIEVYGKTHVFKNKIELYLLHTNNQGQNILHTIINLFRCNSNRLSIFYASLEYVNKKISYEAWTFLCFVQRNNKKLLDLKQLRIQRTKGQAIYLLPTYPYNAENDGLTVFQNLYTMRYSLIIGPHDDKHRRYMTFQKCVESMKPFKSYKSQMSKEEQLKESRILKQLIIAQYALQVISKRLTKNAYAITLWRDSPETITEIVLGQTEKLTFHFEEHDEELADFKYIDIFINGTIKNKDLIDLLKYNEPTIDNSFDVEQKISTSINDLIDEQFRRSKEAFRIPSYVDLVTKIDKKQNKKNKGQINNENNKNIRQDKNTKGQNNKPFHQKQQIQQKEQVQQQRPPRVNRRENEAIKEAIDTMDMLKKKGKNDQIVIIQNSTKPKIAYKTDFKNKGLNELKEMFKVHYESVNSGLIDGLINISEFLPWIFSYNEGVQYKIQDIIELFMNEHVIFAIKLWMVENINTTWTINTQHGLLELKLYAFLIYVGVPLIFIANSMSVEHSSGNNFIHLLCDKDFDNHFKCLHPSQFVMTVGKNKTSISVLYAITLMKHQYRNPTIDKLNILFIQYLLNPKFSHEYTTKNTKSKEIQYLITYIKKIESNEIMPSSDIFPRYENIQASLSRKNFLEANTQCEKEFKECQEYNQQQIQGLNRPSLKMPAKVEIQNARYNEFLIKKAQEDFGEQILDKVNSEYCPTMKVQFVIEFKQINNNNNMNTTNNKNTNKK